MYLAIAPSVFRLPSPESMRSAVSSMKARRAGLDAFRRIRNRAIERGPSGPQPKRGHHQARVAEHGLRLVQPLAFHSADQPVRIHIDVAQRKRGRIAEADAVFVLRFVVAEALGALLHDEPTGTRGCIRQNGVDVGDAAVADPLFAAVDLVACNTVAV